MVFKTTGLEGIYNALDTDNSSSGIQSDETKMEGLVQFILDNVEKNQNQNNFANLIEDLNTMIDKLSNDSVISQSLRNAKSSTDFKDTSRWNTQQARDVQFVIALKIIRRNLKDTNNVAGLTTGSREGVVGDFGKLAGNNYDKYGLDGKIGNNTNTDITNEEQKEIKETFFSLDSLTTSFNSGLTSFNRKFDKQIESQNYNGGEINSLDIDNNTKTLIFTPTNGSKTTYKISTDTVEIGDDIYPPNFTNLKDLVLDSSDKSSIKDKKLSELLTDFSVDTSGNLSITFNNNLSKEQKILIKDKLTQKLSEMMVIMKEITENLNNIHRSANISLLFDNDGPRENIEVGNQQYSLRKDGKVWTIAGNNKTYTSADGISRKIGDADMTDLSIIDKVLELANAQQHETDVETYFGSSEEFGNDLLKKLNSITLQDILKKLLSLDTNDCYSTWVQNFLNGLNVNKIKVRKDLNNNIQVSLGTTSNIISFDLPGSVAYKKAGAAYTFDEQLLQTAIFTKFKDEIEKEDVLKFRDEIKKGYEEFGESILNSSSGKLSLYDFKQAGVLDLAGIANFFNYTLDIGTIDEANKGSGFGFYDIQETVDYDSGLSNPDPTKRTIVYNLDMDQVGRDENKTDLTIMLPIKDKDGKPVLPTIEKNGTNVPVNSNNREEWKKTTQGKAFLKMLAYKINGNTPTVANSNDSNEFAQMTE